VAGGTDVAIPKAIARLALCNESSEDFGAGQVVEVCARTLTSAAPDPWKLDRFMVWRRASTAAIND